MDYRRITYGFIHADIPHLMANIGGQLIFALLICLDVKESSWKRMVKAIFVYLISICGGSFAFDYVPNKETCGLVGASAGVFGLCGMCVTEGFFSILSTLTISPFARDLVEYNQKMWKLVFEGVKLFLSLILIGIDLYYNLVTSSKDESNNIVNHHLDTLYVHMGGLISGIILSISFSVIKYILCREK